MEFDKEKAEHFRNALSNYRELLNLNGTDIEKELEKADKGLTFPEAPKDVIEYLGNIEPLEMTEIEKNAARLFIQGQIRRYGAKEVWQYRMRFKMEWHLTERIF